MPFLRNSERSACLAFRNILKTGRMPSFRNIIASKTTQDYSTKIEAMLKLIRICYKAFVQIMGAQAMRQYSMLYIEGACQPGSCTKAYPNIVLSIGHTIYPWYLMPRRQCMVINYIFPVFYMWLRTHYLHNYKPDAAFEKLRAIFSNAIILSSFFSLIILFLRGG